MDKIEQEVSEEMPENSQVTSNVLGKQSISYLVNWFCSINECCLSGHHSAGVFEFLRAGHGALQPTRLVEPISRGCQPHFCGPIHCRTFFQTLRPRISRKFRI